MSKVLGIVYRCIATHLIKKAGFSCTTARTGAVTLIQRFGSALNLNVHFHILFLDGVYADSVTGSSLRFRWVKAPTSAELTHLTHTIARRVGRSLERLGLLERDAENSYLTGDGVERGHWSRPHERPLSVFGLACGYPPRMAGHGTVETPAVRWSMAALRIQTTTVAGKSYGSSGSLCIAIHSDPYA